MKSMNTHLSLTTLKICSAHIWGICSRVKKRARTMAPEHRKRTMEVVIAGFDGDCREVLQFHSPMNDELNKYGISCSDGSRFRHGKDPPINPSKYDRPAFPGRSFHF